ncbi:MAG: MerR family transcriptional regulator [Acidimicrobiales bacterium]|nr:MerR family transcriptional regulator [Acidimicrobiales bacterium]MDP6299032.1 MerR family transcriptional regulator [Acidimicrobiales bacterium]HJM28770.1 MerR family transcriptional regulator [Acidimicrobiales bacterium]
MEALRDEFPDISISKVRFLETKGLITPERSASGYRRYSEKDLNQLRWVLKMQRDHFLPLNVIRERLGTPNKKSDSTSFQLPQIDPAIPPDETLEFSKEDLIKRTGIPEPTFSDLEQYGILPKRSHKAGETYNADDLFVTQIIVRFLSFGIEPRHLRHVKRSSDSEAALIDQRLTGLSGKEVSRAVSELAKLGNDLKSLLLRRSIHETTQQIEK